MPSLNGSQRKFVRTVSSSLKQNARLGHGRFLITPSSISFVVDEQNAFDRAPLLPSGVGALGERSGAVKASQ